MLRKLQIFISNQFSQAGKEPEQQRLSLASAALLIEISKADYDQSEEELLAIRTLLQQEHDLIEDELEQLMLMAEEQFQVDNAYHPYTSLINQHFTPEQKVRLIETLWEVAYADGEISKYEDHLIRKIADLIYVPHRDFIRSKLKVIGD